MQYTFDVISPLLIKYFFDKSSFIICYFCHMVIHRVIQVNYSRLRSLVLPAITRSVSRYVFFTQLQVADVLFNKETPTHGGYE